ncbi:MAG: hypothetical protein PHY08_11050 [Candidatus Cloacimonetes bacterium]|nr:hypothetical protein [Candidatus Cloacimonadota bacterium]
MKKFLSILTVLLFVFAIGTHFVQAADIADVVYSETNSVVGTSPAASDTLVTFTETTALVGGDYIVLTFPTGTVLNTANIVASDFTIEEDAGTATSPSVISVNASARTIAMYIHAASLADGAGVYTIKLSATAGGDEIVNPTAITTTGTFSVATFASGVAADSGADTDVTFTHDAASQFAIINPTDGTVDAAITVTVQLQDQYGNIVTTGGDKDKDVTLTADGDATGAGLVAITDGTGTKAISDETAETVNLGLTDSETTDYTVTSTQNVVFGPGAVDNIYVSAQPSIGYTYVDFATQPVVQVRDQYSNIVTSDNSPISIEAYTADNFAGSKTEFTGTTLVYATDDGLVGGTADGIATFSGVKYNTINNTGIYLCA